MDPQLQQLQTDVTELKREVADLGYEYKKTTADLFLLETQSSHFKNMFFLGDTSDGKQFYMFRSDGTTPDGNLTGRLGDICLNGPLGKPYYCSVAGTTWVAVATSGELMGDASDGNVTVNSATFTSGPITSNVLTRDAFFDTLTIQTTRTLDTGGYFLYARSLVFEGTGKLTRNGNGGSGGTAGSTYTQGTGGAGATALSAGTLPASNAGVAGTDGTAGGNTGVSDYLGVAATVGTNGSAVTNGLNQAGQAGSRGGAGGSSISGAGVASNVGGSAGAFTASKTGPRDIWFAKLFASWLAGVITYFSNCSQNGGSSGGTGGTGRRDFGAPVDGARGGGGGGAGGSGGDAGYMVVIVNSLTCTGNPNFNLIGGNGGAGGNGGDGSNSSSGNESAGGGGGGAGGDGGNGGCLVLFYHTLTASSPTYTIGGGSGGGAGNGGARGSYGETGSSDGSAGTVGSMGRAGVAFVIQF